MDLQLTNRHALITGSTGGIGYAIDYWRGTFPGWFLGGLILGLISGFYQLAKTIWQR